MRILIFILFSLATGLCYSQAVISGSLEELWWDFKGEQIKDGSHQYASYKGKPYILETTDAAIVLDKNKRVEGLTIRYNVYNDRMELKNGDVYYNISLDERVQEVHLDDHQFAVMRFLAGKSKAQGYFETILKDEKCSLFLRHNMLLKEAEPAKPFQEERPAEFKQQAATSFIRLNTDYLVPVYNKKDFLNLIPDKQAQVARFIKKQKLKFRKPESVRELVEYYNSL
ncbi:MULTISPECIES: hypothetical protein [unclassified Carboxylicivirga]|uniref:hypothetical protein n=1 Tax=Carboxylicivirga TaxID=1628153 RepID=UPI003D357345